jgi:hypothetical protein
MNKSMIDSLSYIKKTNFFIQEQRIVPWSISTDQSLSNACISSDVHLTHRIIAPTSLFYYVDIAHALQF